MRACLLFCGLVAFTSIVHSQDWEIEVVDDGKVFAAITDRRIRLDVAGHPHIACGQDCHYYACFDGASWDYEAADPSFGVGQYTSLALDTAGYPHVSYYDDSEQRLAGSQMGIEP